MRQHHRIDRLSDFIREVREVADEPQHVSPRQEFSSGRELIETVKARREQAQAFRVIADEIEVEMGEETDRYNPDLIDGVLVRWINPGRAARDETAFRHALKTAHRLRAAGERMTDARLPDHGLACARLRHPGQDRLLRHTDRPLRHHQSTQGPGHHRPQRREESRQAVGNRPRRGIRPRPTPSFETNPSAAGR